MREIYQPIEEDLGDFTAWMVEDEDARAEDLAEIEDLINECWGEL
jgi:hypothetical protein